MGLGRICCGGSMRQIIAWGGLLVLVVLHLDFWRGPRPGLVGGWLPEDMAYRLLWMAGAAMYLLYFTSRIWDDGDDGASSHAGRSSRGKPQ